MTELENVIVRHRALAFSIQSIGASHFRQSSRKKRYWSHSAKEAMVSAINAAACLQVKIH